MSQHTPGPKRDQEASVDLSEHSKCPLVLKHISNACDTINVHKRAHSKRDNAADRGYHARRGGHYDSGEDRSRSYVKRGPKVFGSHIL